MAKKENTDADAPKGREVGATEPAEEVPADVEQLLGELGDQASKVYLERVERRSGRRAWLDTINLDIFQDGLGFLAHVRERFGGGLFQIRVHDANGDYVKGGYRRFEIEGPPKLIGEEEREDRDRGDAAEAAAAAAAASEGPYRVLGELMKEFVATMRRPTDTPPAPNPLDMATKMVEMVNAQVSPFLETLAKGGRDRDPWDAFDRGIEMGALIAERAGDDVMAPLAREVISFLREARSGGGTPRDVVARMREQMGQNPGAQGSNTPAQRVEVAQDAPEWARRLAPWLPQLLGWAAAGKRPDLYAEVVLDNLGDLEVDWLAAQFDGRPEEFVAAFYRYFPKAAERRTWFDAFFAAVGDLLTADYEDPGDGGNDEGPGQGQADGAGA